jgi:hypothetical protein
VDGHCKSTKIQLCPDAANNQYLTQMTKPTILGFSAGHRPTESFARNG